MADQMAKDGTATGDPSDALGQFQHWSYVVGRAQQMLLTFWADMAIDARRAGDESGELLAAWLGAAGGGHSQMANAQTESLYFWQNWLKDAPADEARQLMEAATDAMSGSHATRWVRPLFDVMRNAHALLSDHLLAGIDDMANLPDRQREQLRFLARAMIDASAPDNFPATNPDVIDRMVESRGQSLLTGLARMLNDFRRGQIIHADQTAFELGRNLASTPGKVIHETPLYQLIHYEPTTAEIGAIPLLIVPAWINRYYILDLNPRNSFVRWALDQGLSVFILSWKSADETMADVGMDDYALGGIVDALDVVRATLGVPSAHVMGYCVGGTTLAMALAWLAAKGRQAEVATATLLTTQIDFSEAGDLSLLVDGQALRLIESLGADTGYLDGRYMAATFNMLRGRDLIWNHVVRSYLLADDYPAFDLLYWNGHTSNLPLRWHLDYLRSCYRDNLLAVPGGISLGGVGLDVSRIETPLYVQAARDDHIAPAPSVWKITTLLGGPVRFVLAGSGHVAGVINPPSARKYQHWINPDNSESFEAFVEGATEHQGSWWPDWRAWIAAHDGETVPAEGTRRPGAGATPPIEDAPGRYARS